MLSLPVALAVGGGIMWITGGRYVTTNNAYIHQPLVQVSADIAGRIAEVDVTENENVAAGTVMFKLDPKPYKIALDQANAALAAAQLQVTQLRAAYATAEAKLKAAQSLADISQREYERQKSLQSRGVASQSAVDSAHSAALSAENSVSLAQDGVSAAAAALGGNPQLATEDFPAVRAAMAQRETAQRNLSLATVKAPVPGVVSQVDSLNVGQYVTPGMLVASLVQTDKTWVEANFKETQLAGLKVGQPVTVAPDTYSGLKLAGKVQSIGSATGSQFSLIPAQNATGNWVKVVQRVPVRISVTPVKGMPLRDGMSVNVSVDTGQSRLDKLTSLR
jgi:membrane fusion protein (multidrug efflux system)